MVCAAKEAKPKMLEKDEQLKIPVDLILRICLNTKFTKYLLIIIHNKDIVLKILILNNQLQSCS